MKYIDTNIIIRFLIKDGDSLYTRAKEIIYSGDNLFILNEVIAETVYVLIKVYEINKNEVCDAILKFIKLENILLSDKDTIVNALEIFKIKNIDFVDCILCSIGSNKNNEIITLDKKIINFLSNI